LFIYLIYQFIGIYFKATFAGANRTAILFTSILIAVQLFGIEYFLRRIKSSFGRLKICPEMADRSIHLIDRLREQFTSSRLFYLLILLTFSPIIIIKIYSLHAGVSPFFYSYHPGLWALLLDIYDNSVSFFWLYLLGVYLWMIFNISWMLSKISERSYYESLKIEPLDADKVGGLKPIRELILWISIYYFLIIILAAATYLVAEGLLLYESISLFIFWLVGVIFSISGWHKLRRLLSGKIQSEISSLSEIMEYKRAQLIDIITKT